MILLATGRNGLQPIINTNQLEIVDYVCEKASLLEINPYLIKKEFPLINNLTFFIQSGSHFVNYDKVTEKQYYIINSQHEDFIDIVRDFQINKIIE
jgi:hypothetical protein